MGCQRFLSPGLPHYIRGRRKKKSCEFFQTACFGFFLWWPPSLPSSEWFSLPPLSNYFPEKMSPALRLWTSTALYFHICFLSPWRRWLWASSTAFTFLACPLLLLSFSMSRPFCFPSASCGAISRILRRPLPSEFL